ncbi:MAG: hypothetical protein V7782_06315 [Psychromonas sp.]
MRMLKAIATRWKLVLLVLLVVLIGLLTSVFIRSFNINDYSHFISQQIEKSTGYQVSFQQIDSNLYQKSHFSISGVSLSSKQQQEDIYIEQVNIEVKDFDIWNRQLELQLLQLIGVNITSEQVEAKPKPAIKLGDNELLASLSSKDINELVLKRLYVEKLEVVDLKADINKAQWEVKLQGANLSSNKLLVIENHQFNNHFLSANFDLQLKTFKVQNPAKDRLNIDELELQTDFNLLALQGSILSNIKRIQLNLPTNEEIIFDTILVNAELDKTQLLLHKLSANVFEGQLDLQATARFALTPFSSSAISFKQLNIDSLLIKDMQLQSALVEEFISKPSDNNPQPLELPVENVFLEQVNLQSLNISRADQQATLLVSNLNSSIQNLQIIKNNQLIDLPEKDTSSAFFSLEFDYLNWFGREFEGFSVAGSLSQDDQNIMLIKKYIIE